MRVTLNLLNGTIVSGTLRSHIWQNNTLYLYYVGSIYDKNNNPRKLWTTVRDKDKSLVSILNTAYKNKNKYINLFEKKTETKEQAIFDMF